MVKPKPNSLIVLTPLSNHTTPPRAKHIHMSHTPPTPLTSTSPVLDKTPEPRVPLIHALTATTPHPDHTPQHLSTSTTSQYIHNISVQAHKPLQIIKALTATGWGKQKETLMATYKAVMRPALEYASSVWSPIASSTSINKLQVMQNAALRTATGCTQDTNIQHLHDETLTLPIHEHLQLHATQYKQKTQHPSHPLHKHTPYFNTPRLKKTLFLTTAATQQTFPQTPTQSLQRT